MSHIHYCRKSPAAAQIIIIQLAPLFTSMLYQNLEIILTFKNANIADLNEMPQNAGTLFGSSLIAYKSICL